MNNAKQTAVLRLKRVLLEDKSALDGTSVEMLRSDLVRVFNTYFEYDISDLKIAIDVNAKGSFDVAVSLTADRSVPVNGIK